MSEYDSFDHRTRQLRLLGERLVFFASDPCNGWGERMPRQRTLMVGPWKLSLTRRRR